MTSSRFDLDPTLKTLNFFLLQFIEWSGSKNHDQIPTLAKPGIVLIVSSLIGDSFNAIFLKYIFVLSQKQIWCKFDFHFSIFF